MDDWSKLQEAPEACPWSKLSNSYLISEENCVSENCMTYPESTKQMERTLRAKVMIFFKSENLKSAFNKK